MTLIAALMTVIESFTGGNESIKCNIMLCGERLYFINDMAFSRKYYNAHQAVNRYRVSNFQSSKTPLERQVQAPGNQLIHEQCK